MTEWKPIPIAPGYAASTDGRIRGKRGRELNVYRNDQGKLQVVLRIDGRAVCRQVHRLVAAAHLDIPIDEVDVRHADGDYLNNAVSNLTARPRRRVS